MSRIVSNKIEVQLIKGGYKKSNSGIYKSGNTGYWSNLDKDENENFIKILECSSPREAVREIIPDQENQIFSEKREAALELLDIQKGNVCIDYGCMWGNLLIHSAKKSKLMVGIDQTEQSLKFLNQRLQEEKIPVGSGEL